MIAALAEGAPNPGGRRVTPRPPTRAAGFLLDTMRTADGKLLHSYKDGQAKFNAYLDDYANLIDGLTRLFEATGEPRWIEAALEPAAVMIDEFADPDAAAASSTRARGTRR